MKMYKISVVRFKYGLKFKGASGAVSDTFLCSQILVIETINSNRLGQNKKKKKIFGLV